MIELVDITLFESAVALVVLLAASVARGYSGFGFSAVLVAGLAFIIDPVEAVPLAVALEVLASIVQGRSIWDDVDWRHFGVLLAAALLGNPIGVLLLTSVDAQPLRAATFITLAVLTGALLAGTKLAVPATLWAFFTVGVIAGVVNGATAMAGLVLVLAMSAMSVAPTEMRGTLIAYFFASDLAVLCLLWATGQLDGTFVTRTLVAIPIMVLGVTIGSRQFAGTSVESFRRTTLMLLLAISLVGLARLAL